MNTEDWFKNDEEQPKEFNNLLKGAALERGSDGRYLPKDGDSNKNKCKKKEKANKRLNQLDYNLKEEFSKRRLRATDFLNYCEGFYEITKQKVYNDLKKPWKDIQLQDKIIYYLFLQYIDKK